jgi:hypothetical protein
MSVRLAMALLVLMLPLAARAQQNATPAPIVRTTIDPPRVMVGQPATLRVEVLAPNYMTSPPELPSFQLRNAVTRQLQSVNTNEQQDGIQYAGVRFEFAIYPLEAGSFAITEQKLTIKYAAEPPATREAVVSLPQIEFESFIPDAAAGLHPFLAANNLTIEQAIQRSSEQLKVGDAVTRVITSKAEGTPAMLLPPTAFPAIDGLAVYPAQPSLQDKTDGRSDVMSASRVDSATYMLEKPGDYLLPAIDVRWWNPADGRIETAHLDAVALQVAGNPTAQGTAAATEGGVRQSLNSSFEFVADHWLLTLIAVAILALLGWFAPRLTRAVALRRQQHREAWLQSESYFFERLRHAARRGDARAAYFALLDWLQRFEPTAPLHTVEAFKAVAQDPALDRQINSIERELFASDHNGAAWSPHQLLDRVSAARRGLRRKAVGGARASLPRQLNPSQCPPAEARGRRMPAR